MSDEKDPVEQNDPPTEETETPDPGSDATAEGQSAATDAAFATGSPADPGESLDAIKTELAEAKEAALRAQAEMENVRRRSRAEVDELRRYQSLPVIRDVLSPIDNLRLALDAAEKTGNVDELTKGIQMVLAQFDSVFNNHYAKPIEAEGVAFDPNLHEALQQIPSADHEPMTVLQDFQRGYKMHDRVIRPSKVIVSCAPPEPSPAAEVAEPNEAPPTDAPRTNEQQPTDSPEEPQTETTE